MILFHDWTLKTDGLLARQFDNLSQRLEVLGDLPEGWDWAMLVQVGDAMDIIPLSPMEGGVGHTLTEDQLSLSGYYTMQLRGTQGDVVKHTNVIQTFVASSLSGCKKWPTVPSEFLEVEQRITQLNEHPPVPGENGYWMIWDYNTGTYEASLLPLPGLSQNELQSIVNDVLTALPVYYGEVEDV